MSIYLKQVCLPVIFLQKFGYVRGVYFIAKNYDFVIVFSDIAFWSSQWPQMAYQKNR